jgi:hypothetical protein
MSKYKKSSGDGEKLSRTEDVLFLSGLLKMLSQGGAIRETRGVKGEWFYEYFTEEQRAASPKGQYLLTASIRRRFWDLFFSMRSVFSSAEGSGCRIWFKGKLIRDFEGWLEGEPWNFGASLPRPFSKEGDPLMENLHLTEFFEGKMNTKERGKGSRGVVCPLDGPVVQVTCRVMSPPKTWKNSCGREWQVKVCPQCLGVIKSRLATIS